MKTISSGGPCRYTLVDGQAAMALEASDIKDLDGGEEGRGGGGGRKLSSKNSMTDSLTGWQQTDRMAEPIEHHDKNEITEAFRGGARLLVTRLQKEGVELSSLARGCVILRGCRPGSIGHASVMSATHRSWV